LTSVFICIVLRIFHFAPLYKMHLVLKLGQLRDSHSNIRMQHYECLALCEANSFEQDHFWAASLASSNCMSKETAFSFQWLPIAIQCYNFLLIHEICFVLSILSQTYSREHGHPGALLCSSRASKSIMVPIYLPLHTSLMAKQWKTLGTHLLTCF